VEAWDEAAGAWMRYDPTPTDLEYSGRFMWNMLELYLDFLEFQWSRLIVNYSFETQLGIAQYFREVISNPRASLTPDLDGLRRIGDALSAPAAISAAFMICAALFFTVRSIKNRRPEITLLNNFLRVMKRNGYRKHASEGLSEFLERVDDASLRVAASPFVREFEKIYYKDAAMDAHASKRLKGYINNIVRRRP